jgi:hypothetical protein
MNRCFNQHNAQSMTSNDFGANNHCRIAMIDVEHLIWIFTWLIWKSNTGIHETKIDQKIEKNIN